MIERATMALRSPLASPVLRVVERTATCARCGETFAQQPMRRITCSDACRAEYLRGYEPDLEPAPEPPPAEVSDVPGGAGAGPVPGGMR